MSLRVPSASSIDSLGLPASMPGEPLDRVQSSLAQSPSSETEEKAGSESRLPLVPVTSVVPL